MGNVYEDVIQEFYAIACIEGDHINCWLRGREFLITRESIQEILEVRPTTPHTSLQYDERREKIEPLMEILGGQINRKAFHTITFTSEMWTVAYIMIFNLYPVRNLTNLLALRSLFLFDLFTHKEIDICSHIYRLFPKCITKRNLRLTLPFPSLVMSLITRARVKIPSGLQMMQREDPINAQTMTRSKAHIPKPFVGVPSNSKRWRKRRHWAFHFSSGGHYTTLFPNACVSIQLSWSSNQKGWVVAWHARFSHKTLHISIHLPRRPNHCPLVSDWWHDEEPAAELRVWVRGILVSLAIPVKKWE